MIQDSPKSFRVRWKGNPGRSRGETEAKEEAKGAPRKPKQETSKAQHSHETQVPFLYAGRVGELDASANDA